MSDISVYDDSDRESRSSVNSHIGDNSSTASREDHREQVRKDLYLDSTISIDGTSSGVSREQDLLSRMTKLSGSGRGQPPPPVSIVGGGGPPPPPPPPHYVPDPASRHGASPYHGRGPARPPPGFAPGPGAPLRQGGPVTRVIPGGVPGYPPMAHMPVGYAPPPSALQGPFPFKKVTKKARWRLSMMRRRGIVESNGNGPSHSTATKPQMLSEAHDSESSKVESADDNLASKTAQAPIQNQTTVGKEKNEHSNDSVDPKGKLPEAMPTNKSQQAARDHGTGMSNGFSSRAMEDGDQDPQEHLPPLTIQNLGLAESLNVIAEKHLNIDPLDRTQETAQFIGYLFDTIQTLENQIRFLRAQDDLSAPSSDTESESEAEDTPMVPRSQILHRIICSNQEHRHSNYVYEDQPVLKKGLFNGETGLYSKVHVGNIITYIGQHPDICFIVYKEYHCMREQGRRRGRSRNDSSSKRRERLSIVSPALERALARVAEFEMYPRQSTPHDVVYKELDAPYPFFFHHRKKLKTLSEQGEYKEAMVPLLGHLDENYGREYDEAEKLIANGRITANHITKLFKPSQMVVSRNSRGVSEASILSTYPNSKSDKMEFTGWTWTYDGNNLRRAPWSGLMSEGFDEEMLIADLPIHPTEFARKEILTKLEERGRKYWSMRDQKFLCYTGWDKYDDHCYANARFMVDIRTYYLLHPHASSADMDEDLIHSGTRRLDPRPQKINRKAELEPEYAMLLPATAYGFNLLEKKWVSLYVDNFHPVDWNKKAFDRLVLPSQTKEMIRSLIEVQMTAKKMDDIIAGKGNGLIILLHGSPGTGKTLTAESVAEIAEKPLYRVTCGDIGTEAPKVEEYLRTVLHLVLLLDEADVFLEERTMADLQRNSLVSVFLRVLEYYEGILILTSNRVGTFDEAFKSRIQVAIHYDNLTKRSRKAIWRNFFDMIEDSSEEDANMPELERRLDELAGEEMNGRQIRNALLIARQLAKHRKERLDWEHLSQVIKTSAAFNKYLKAVKGHSDEVWAREEQIR